MKQARFAARVFDMQVDFFQGHPGDAGAAMLIKPLRFLGRTGFDALPAFDFVMFDTE